MIPSLPSSKTRTNTWVGRSMWSNDPFFKGRVRDVRIYDDERTASEVASDYAGNIDLSDPDLRAWYHLQGDLSSGLSNQAQATANFALPGNNCDDPAPL